MNTQSITWASSLSEASSITSNGFDELVSVSRVVIPLKRNGHNYERLGSIALFNTAIINPIIQFHSSHLGVKELKK